MGIRSDLPHEASECGPDRTDTAVYAWVLEHRQVDPEALAAHLSLLGLDPGGAQAALDRLVRLQLVHLDPQEPGQAQAVAPHAAVHAVCAPLEERMAELHTQLAAQRTMLAGFLPHYLGASSGRAGDSVEVIASRSEVRAALEYQSHSCASEVIASQPGGVKSPEAMEESLRRDRALLSRGVRMRTLYHHTARFNASCQAYVEQVSVSGAEYRTAHQLFGRLIVFDRHTAFLPLADGSFGAVVVRQESLVAYLCEIFDQTWALAQPFTAAAEEGLAQVAQAVDDTIVRLLAAGLKDEAVARRLGMSLRTARRHIADILEQLGAESRFQAGVAAARSGLLDE
jgi:DNA-binding CsgD family transcriptional regulator